MEGVYDLEIEGATYDRDNGQFECRMKEGGSGRELHSKSVTVTGECWPLLNWNCTQYGRWFMLVVGQAISEVNINILRHFP